MINRQNIRYLEPPRLSHSERHILGLLLRSGELTQAGIAERSSLAQQSVSRLIAGLLAHGCLEEVGQVPQARRGQRPTTFKLAPGYAASFGVTIMADTVSVALLDFSGQVLGEAMQALADMHRATVLESLQELMDRLIAESGVDRRRIVGLGAGVSGYFTGTGTLLNTPLSLDDWALVDIEALLSDHFRMPAWVDNDGNAAAVGESMVGVGRWCSNFAYLYFATGFGGGVIIDGELLRGRHGNAGEFAGILPEGYPHPNLDGLRTMIGARGVALDNVADMIDRFDPAWAGVREWIESTVPSLDVMVSAIHSVIDPEAIVLGGRIPQQLAGMLIPRITLANINRRNSPRPEPKLVQAEAKGDATAVGAALMPLKKFFFS